MNKKIVALLIASMVILCIGCNNSGKDEDEVGQSVNETISTVETTTTAETTTIAETTTVVETMTTEPEFVCQDNPCTHLYHMEKYNERYAYLLPYIPEGYPIENWSFFVEKQKIYPWLDCVDTAKIAYDPQMENLVCEVTSDTSVMLYAIFYDMTGPAPIDLVLYNDEFVYVNHFSWESCEGANYN